MGQRVKVAAMSVVFGSGLGALLLRVPMVGPWHGPYPVPITLLAEESGSEGGEGGEGGVSASAGTSAGAEVDMEGEEGQRVTSLGVLVLVSG